jgi:hypothetical protein
VSVECGEGSNSPSRPTNKRRVSSTNVVTRTRSKASRRTPKGAVASAILNGHVRPANRQAVRAVPLAESSLAPLSPLGGVKIGPLSAPERQSSRAAVFSCHGRMLWARVWVLWAEYGCFGLRRAYPHIRLRISASVAAVSGGCARQVPFPCVAPPRGPWKTPRTSKHITTTHAAWKTYRVSELYAAGGLTYSDMAWY